MFNRKIESSTFDVFALYVCMGFVTYVVGAIAYGIGKEKGQEEEASKRPRYHVHYPRGNRYRG